MLQSELGIPENAVAEFSERNNLTELPWEEITEFCRRNHIKTLVSFDADTRERHNIGGNGLYASFKREYEQKPKSRKLRSLCRTN